MKKFLFLFAALCLTLADAVRADTDLSAYTNVIYVAPATITLDGSRVPVALDGSAVESPSDLTLSICMDNAADIRGFQFDLYLPDGMTPVKTAKGKIVAALTSARLPEDDEHTLTLAEQTDGAIRLLCGSQYDETFTGTSGEIATIKVSIAALPDGTYPVTLKAVKLTETDITKCYEVPEVVTSLTITTASDDSEEPNYANVIYVAPATITLDGASATLTLNAPTAPVASDGSPVESPSEVDLPICMDNTAAIRGFQFDLYLPDGMTPVKTAKGKIVAALTSARLPEDDEHTLTVAEQADGSLRFLCGSQYDETFTGTSGEIATVRVSVAGLSDGEYPVTLKAIKLTETDITKCYEVPEMVTTLTITTAPDDSQAINDQIAAEAVMAMIAAIGEVDNSDECKARVTAARQAYEALSDAQKALVTNDDILTVAEETCVIIAKDDLSTAISEAEAYYDSIKDDYPYLASVLQWVIDSAKLVMTDDEATQAQVENATAAVNDAMAQAKDIMAPVTAIPTSGDKPRDAYDLSGRHVAQPTKGLYIINDKKVLIYK